MSDPIAERSAFAERLRLQLRARYPALNVAVDLARFGLRVSGPGVDVTLALGPLHNSVIHQPDRTASLIADYVTSVQRQLGSQGGGPEFSLRRVLWCVRTRRYLADIGRAGELLTTPVGDELIGFVAEPLPGSYMRGVPRQDWERMGHHDAEVRAAADAATARRFGPLIERIRRIDRVARDGWQVSGTDQLFQGSCLLVPGVLRAFCDRAGGDVLLGIPDRSVLMAVPLASDAARRFRQRVTQAYRDGMSPCSREVLVTDGETLAPHSAAKSRRAGIMAWLDD